MSMIRWGVILGILLYSCAAPVGDMRPLPIEVIVESDSGTLLGGVPVKVNGDVVGRTDANGALQTRVVGPPGSVVLVSQECPDDHRRSEAPATLRIRRYETSGLESPLTVVLRCRLELRIAAIVVRTEGHPHVAVHVDGEMVTETNDDGIAHLARLVPPGTELLVELDASRYPQLRPQRTSRALSVADSHDVFVIDQHYEPVRRSIQVSDRRRRILKIE